MKTGKLILKIVGVISILTLLFGAGCYALIYNISHSLDCEGFNIDNIEVRTETDIPDLSGTPVCTYDEVHNVKSNFFLIDKSVDMQRYITRNHFTPIGTNPIPQFTYRADFNTAISTRPHPEHLYTKNGRYIGEESGKMDSWLYILDTATGEMWIEVLRTQHH